MTKPRYSMMAFTGDCGVVYYDGDRLLDEDEVLDLLNSTAWTRVEDGLPEHDDVVRVALSDQDVRTEAHAYFNGSKWIDAYSGNLVEIDGWRVTHWQPIRGPKPCA